MGHGLIAARLRHCQRCNRCRFWNGESPTTRTASDMGIGCTVAQDAARPVIWNSMA